MSRVGVWIAALALGLIGLLAGCGGFIEGEKTGHLPLAGQYPGLVPQDKKPRVLFMEKDLQKYLGDRAGLFGQFGLRSLYTGDYTLGGEGNYLLIEGFQMGSAIGAAGVYYYYAGKILQGAGQTLEIGAQGLLDTVHEKRNLYFYKGQYFVSLVYTGKEPVPDLQPLAQHIAEAIPGRNWKPEGFRYLQIEGIPEKFTRVTYGNALNMDFLPPAVMGYATGYGTKTRVFACTFNDPKGVEQADSDLLRYLRLEATEYVRASLKVGNATYQVHQAVDKDEGLVLYTRWNTVLFIITAPTDLQRGHELLTALIERARTEHGMK